MTDNLSRYMENARRSLEEAYAALAASEYDLAELRADRAAYFAVRTGLLSVAYRAADIQAACHNLQRVEG
jgi:uncharacterized protein (UPF0332 family)